MRYEAIGEQVYDRETDQVVPHTGELCSAEVAAAQMNQAEKDNWEIDRMMRSNRASGF